MENLLREIRVLRMVADACSLSTWGGGGRKDVLRGSLSYGPRACLEQIKQNKKCLKKNNLGSTFVFLKTHV